MQEPSALPQPSESIEIRVAWYAGCLSVLLALFAFTQPLVWRLVILLVGGIAAVALAHPYLRRATALSSVLVTCGSAVISMAAVTQLSELSWRTGVSLSQAGGAQRPGAWLLSSTSWCFGVGVLATGRLVVREGYRRGYLTARGYRLGSLLPVLAFAGFAIVGVLQVGATHAFSLLHNLAAWSACGAFWVGMLATPWLRGIPRALRIFSIVAAVLVLATWLPTGLRFLEITRTSPISTLHMELLVFPLMFVWLGWLARSWDARETGV